MSVPYARHTDGSFLGAVGSFAGKAASPSPGVFMLALKTYFIGMPPKRFCLTCSMVFPSRKSGNKLKSQKRPNLNYNGVFGEVSFQETVQYTLGGQPANDPDWSEITWLHQ